MRYLGAIVGLALGAAVAKDALAAPRVVDCARTADRCSPAQIKIIDATWNNTVLKNCRISNLRTGIVIRGVENFTLASCVIENISKGSGVFLDPDHPSGTVTLEGNTLRNIAKNGIAAPEGSVGRLTITGNTLANVATKGRRGLHHGIYIQGPGSRVFGNNISNVQDGNGIAIRSYAEIFGNTISGTGKSGIGYFNDHPGPHGSTLRIRGNRVSDYGRRFSERAGIEVLTHSRRYPVIGTIRIEDNRVTGRRPVACNGHPNCKVR